MKEKPAHVAAVIFDWAGTVVDPGSWAPVMAFLDVFHQKGIDLELEQVRRFMGMAKRDHVRAVLDLPEVATCWKERYGMPYNETDLDNLYRNFLDFQDKAILEHSEIIEGVPELIRDLRLRGIRIGSTTGYPREIMEKLIPQAAKGGFSPDFVCTVSEVPEGRPAPWMVYKNAEALGVYPMSRIIKVDDTVAGIEAGINAGCWCVGVTRTGNLVGLTEREFRGLNFKEKQVLLDRAGQALRKAGAHAVIESVVELPAVIDHINRRLETEAA